MALSCLLRLAAATAAAGAAGAPCDVDTYYAGVNLTIQDQNALASALHARISQPHDVIPYSSSGLDTWDALKVLDRDPANSSKVRLIYSDVGMSAALSGRTDGWNREHLWPKSFGVGYVGAGTSDLHCLRAADWNVNSARGNLPFGSCNASMEGTCVSPAHPEAAPDTAKTSSLFMPPASVRGDIARCLFYMAMRYDGSDLHTEDLLLSDCPCPSKNTMGNLSTLLAWHAADPVDAAEVARNAQVCGDYQHNRNPFIDHPELVARLWPSDNATACSPVCDGETSSAEDGDGEGNEEAACLAVGDVCLLGVDASDPDAIAMVALAHLPAGTTLYVTDDSWTGSSFRGSEGTLTYVAGAAGVPAGAVLRWSKSQGDPSAGAAGGKWSVTSGFQLAVSGETLFVYQFCGGMSSPQFLFGMTMTDAGWVETGGAVDASHSVAPAALLNADLALALEPRINYAYRGQRTGTRADLLARIGSAAFWDGSDSAKRAAAAPDSLEVIGAATENTVVGATCRGSAPMWAWAWAVVPFLFLSPAALSAVPHPL